MKAFSKISMNWNQRALLHHLDFNHSCNKHNPLALVYKMDAKGMLINQITFKDRAEVHICDYHSIYALAVHDNEKFASPWLNKAV